MKNRSCKVSVVVPVFNSAGTIEDLVSEIRRVLVRHKPQIILVNDGSKDQSEQTCRRIAKKNRDVVFLSLRKNFGEHNAVMCGLNHATGDFTAIIDDDFQNPPEQILTLLEEARKGVDVVYSKYKKKEHPWLRNLGSMVNNWVANFLLNKPKDLYMSSFKVIQKEIVKEIILYQGPFPYIDGLILRVTDNIQSVWVEHSMRKTGKSNYTIKKLVSLYLNMFLNFSIKPLRVFTISGFVIFLIGVVLMISFLIERLFYPATMVGWTSITLLILTFSGFQIVFLGLIGEYLGKQYLDQNGTPQCAIKMKIVNGREIPVA